VPPPNAIGKLFQVFISPEGTPPDLDPEGPGFAGSFVFFGQPHDHGAPVSFTIPIDGALDRMSQAGRLRAGEQISFSLIAAGQEATAPGAAESGELQSVHVEVL
jgi:hypothetical protein